MFKITAILCVLAVNGQNLCLEGDLPLTKQFIDMTAKIKGYGYADQVSA